MVQEAVKKLAENTLGIVLARFVTPGLLAIALWLGSQYLARLDEALDMLDIRLSRQEETQQQTNQTIAAIEASRLATSKARDSDIADIVGKLDRLQLKLDSTVNDIATVTAKVEVLLSRSEPTP